MLAAGRNDNGCLALDHTTDQHTFQKITKLDNLPKDFSIAQIVAGGHYSLLLTNQSGLVFSAGENGDGQLGLGHNNNVCVFTQVPLDLIDQSKQKNEGEKEKSNNDSIKFIACGEYFSYLLTKKGNVWCCGGNDNG